MDIATVLGGRQPGSLNRRMPKVLDRGDRGAAFGEVSPQTRATLEKQMHDPRVLQASLDDPVTRVNAAMIAGLVLGAPEFQRR